MSCENILVVETLCYIGLVEWTYCMCFFVLLCSYFRYSFDLWLRVDFLAIEPSWLSSPQTKQKTRGRSSSCRTSKLSSPEKEVSWILTIRRFLGSQQLSLEAISRETEFLRRLVFRIPKISTSLSKNSSLEEAFVELNT